MILNRSNGNPRRGAILVLVALMLVGLLGMVAFATDIGYIVLVRTQLQIAADAAAMAAGSVLGGTQNEIIATARQFAEPNIVSGTNVALSDSDVEFGTWDVATRRFTPTGQVGNAVRVTCRRDSTNPNGESPLFFARVFGNRSFSMTAQAVAMVNPRDIAFVVDLSGSMNDDTEPGWATSVINSTFSGQGNVGNPLVQQFYDDFSFGSFPGVMEYIGDPLGVGHNKWAYSEMTKDGGPLSSRSLSAQYRIQNGDNEGVRKQKAYRWMIDFQIARVMPAAVPVPDSATNYAYWEKYLDYILLDVKIVPPKPPGGKAGNGKKGSKSKGSKSKGSKSKGSKSKGSKSKGSKSKGSKSKGSKSKGSKSKGSKSKGSKSKGSKSKGGKSKGGGGAKSPPIGKMLTPDTAVDWLAVWRRPDAVSWNSDRQRLAFVSSGVSPLGLSMNYLGLMASPGTPPTNRGRIPPNQDGDRIYRFNNPNKSTFPSAQSPKQYLNWIGYLTYAQFMLDHGRDLRPVGGQYVPLSINNPDCPYHSEATAGGSFSFPPREQPTHAARRALIAAIEIVRQRNATLSDPNQGDKVSVISFDTLSGAGPVIEQALTSDFQQAMQSCTQLQAVGDKGATTATDAGLAMARTHLTPVSKGGAGRESTNKVVVLLTDGVPNLYSSSGSDINAFISQNPSANFYNNGAYWYDAALMQTATMQQQRWNVYPVGVGLGTDYDFMDRLSRMGKTANSQGQGSRGSGNPAEYEQRLTEIFKKIITNPRARLVQ